MYTKEENHALAMNFALKLMDRKLAIEKTVDQRELLATYARDYAWAREFFDSNAQALTAQGDEENKNPET